VSIQAMAAVIDHSQTVLGARLVLLSIANHAHKDGTGADPGHRAISEEAKISTRQVIRLLPTIVALGELHIAEGEGRRGRGGRYNLYTVCLPGLRWPSVADFLAEGSGDNMAPPAPTAVVTSAPGSGDNRGDGSGDNRAALLTCSSEPSLTGAAAPREEVASKLAEVFGEARTRTARQARDRVVDELAAVGATIPEITRRLRLIGRRFTGAAVTPHTLVKYWDEYEGPKVAARPTDQHPLDEECGHGRKLRELLSGLDDCEPECLNAARAWAS